LAYTTFAQVKAVVSTNITDANVTDLITESDAYLDATLDTGTYSAIQLQMLSRIYTAYRCMLRDPNSRSLGGYSENRGVTMRLMKEEFNALAKAFEGGGSFVAHVDEIA